MQVNVRSLTAYEPSLLLASEDCACRVSVCVCVIAANTFSHQDIPFTKTCLSTWPPNICEVSCILMKISQLQPDPGLYTLEKTHKPQMRLQHVRLRVSQQHIRVWVLIQPAPLLLHKPTNFCSCSWASSGFILQVFFSGFWKYKICCCLRRAAANYFSQKTNKIRDKIWLEL